MKNKVLKVNRYDLVHFNSFFYEKNLLDNLHGDFIFDNGGVFRLGCSDGVRVSFNFYNIPNSEIQQALRLLNSFFDGIEFIFDKDKHDTIEHMERENDRQVFIHGKPKKEYPTIEVKQMKDLLKGRSKKYYIERLEDSDTYWIFSKKKKDTLVGKSGHLIDDNLLIDIVSMDMYSELFKKCGFKFTFTNDIVG